MGGGRELGDAALEEVSLDHTHVLPPLREGGEAQLRVELAIPTKPKVKTALIDGRVTLAPGPWPHETLAAWKG